VSGVARASGSIAYKAIGIAGEALRPYLAPRLEKRDGAGWDGSAVASSHDPQWLLGKLAHGIYELSPELSTGSAAHLRDCAFELIELRNRAAHFDLAEGPTLALRTVDRTRVLLRGLGILDPSGDDELGALEIEAAALRFGSERVGKSLEELRSSYLEAILERTRYLDFRGIAFAGRRSAGTPESIFIPPKLAEFDRLTRSSPTFAFGAEDAAVWPTPEHSPDVVRSWFGGSDMQSDDALTWEQCLAELRTVVLAGPGAGKTSLLQHVARAVATGSDVVPAGTLPILVQARAVAQGAGDGSASLASYLVEQHEPAYAELISHALETRRFLLLVDSLDEAGPAAARRAVADLITSFAREHDGGRVVVTSREAGFEAWGVGPGFRRLHLLPFDLPQVRRYVTAWLALQGQLPEEDAVDRVMEEFVAAAVLPLAATPLLLALLMLVRDSDGTLPERRSRLYDLAVRELAEEWPTRRGGDFDPDEVIGALRPLALRCAYESSTVPERDLVAALAAVRVAAGASTADARRSARRLLRTAEDRTGIVVGAEIQEAEPHWEFLHRSIAEHLAGSELADRWLGGESSLEPLLADPALRETFVFAVAHLDEADPEQAARALTSLLDTSDPLEVHTGRRARLVLGLLADEGVRATGSLRARVVDRVRRLAVDDRSPWRVESVAVLARYAAATGEDPWVRMPPPPSAHPGLAAFASWAAHPDDEARTRALVEVVQRLPWGDLTADDVGEPIVAAAHAAAGNPYVVGCLLIAPGGNEGSLPDEAFAGRLERAGVPSFAVSDLPRLVEGGVPRLWILHPEGQLTLEEFIALCGCGLPDGVLWQAYAAWDAEPWMDPDEDQLARLSALAERDPAKFVEAYDFAGFNDMGNDFDAATWWPALERISNVHDGAVGYQARRRLAAIIGLATVIHGETPTSSVMRLAACDEAHLDEDLVLMHRWVFLPGLARPVDGELADALRSVVDHADPRIRGSAARALLCIHHESGDRGRAAFLHERAYGPALLADLDGHCERDPQVLPSLLERVLALAAATADPEWSASVVQILDQTLDAAAHLPDTSGRRAFARTRPLWPYQHTRSPLPESAMSSLVGRLDDAAGPGAAIAAEVIALMDRSIPLADEFARLIADGTSRLAAAAVRALRDVDFRESAPLLDALIPAFARRDAPTLRGLGDAFRAHADPSTRAEAEALLAIALDEKPRDPSLLGFARGLLGR
jgi:NACHT domain